MDYSLSENVKAKICLETIRKFVYLDWVLCELGFPGSSMVKNLPANAGDTGDTGSILGLKRSPGIGNGALQYSCLENSMDRGAWSAKSQTQLSD